MSETVLTKVDYDLGTLVKYIGLGEIGLPDIQRAFVWKNTKVRHLFDSMHKGFPAGIQADKFDNEDKMNLHLMNIVKSRLGIPVMANIHVHFEGHDNFRVMVVKCGKTPSPVFFKEEDTGRFYIGNGPSTTELSPSQTQNYIQQRFST